MIQDQIIISQSNKEFLNNNRFLPSFNTSFPCLPFVRRTCVYDNKIKNNYKQTHPQNF